MDDAVAVANELASEHVEIETQDAEALASRIVNAGAIFVGTHGSEAGGRLRGRALARAAHRRRRAVWSGLSCNDFSAADEQPAL